MAGMKISELDFVRLLPAFMRDDEAVIALSNAMNKLLGEPAKRLSTIRTWDKIDELNATECDEMAWELDVDWYDSEGMSLKDKQTALKEAQQIKRKRGTKWAVQRLVASMLGEGEVAEWYEINGDPYTFVILTTATEIDTEHYARFMAAANAASNERSHMAGVFYHWPQGPEQGIEYAAAHSYLHYDFRKCGTHHRPAVVGFVVKSGGIETEPETSHTAYDFPELNFSGAPIAGTAIVGKAVLRAGTGAKNCGTYPRETMRGAMMRVSAAAVPEDVHALYSFPKCGTNKCSMLTTKPSILDAMVLGETIL